MSNPPVSVLVVDDQPDNLRTLAAILRNRGYQVRSAVSGAIALSTARAQPPDVILLDIRMPQMDGYKVCAILKSSPQTREIPVIFLSALDDVADKVKAFETGGADYITKPFQAEEVLARIGHQLTIRQQHQQLLQLYHQVQSLNNHLEQQIQNRTVELQQALGFETTLKRITDKVRDSLDETQILQTAVEELAQALQAHCCDAALYTADQTASIIRYQFREAAQPTTKGQVLPVSGFSETFHQLQQGVDFAFCQLTSSPIRNHSAILACPIQDDQAVLGDLWLFKSTASSYSEPEIRLVRQVANQCAIALRQARLYQAAQAQLNELQRLNQLKDDFLNTISHELRTPLASIHMVIQLLMTATHQGRDFLEKLSGPESVDNKVAQYLKILQDECERELKLVQDLLDLQQLDAGNLLVEFTSVHLCDWLSHVAERFEYAAQSEQKTFELHLAPDLPTVTTDISGLSRVLTELLTNACKYAPAGGTISFTAHADTEKVYFKVCNSGTEISAEERSRIFDRFYRTPSHDPWKHGGTGLGLALVKKLTEHLQGAIEVTSENNLTCFAIALPIQASRHSSSDYHNYLSSESEAAS